MTTRVTHLQLVVDDQLRYELGLVWRGALIPEHGRASDWDKMTHEAKHVHKRRERGDHERVPSSVALVDE